MPVLIHSVRRGRNPAVIFPSACLPGAALQAHLNAEFHFAAARPMDAYDHNWLTADHGLFLGRI